MIKRGKFITLEGIDGAGKSSHVEFLLARVRELGVEVLSTREPGGTQFGQKLRELVLDHQIDAMPEALVMFADRSAHIAAVIEPALSAGIWIACDRFTDSTYAYQCGGRGISRELVAGLERMVHPQLQPDATFLFDLDPAIAYDRQRARSREPDKFERETAEFFRKVREAYLQRAREHSGRIHVIDAAGDIGQVRARLGAAFQRAFR